MVAIDSGFTENECRGGPPSRKLRVCVIIPKLEIGGAEAHVLSLIEHIDRSRFAVSLVCLSRGDPGMERRAAGCVEAFRILRFRWRRFPVSFAELVRLLRKGRFDIVHCHLPLADSLGRTAAWLAGVPVRVTTEHGKFLGKPWWHLLFERIIEPATDARICVSRDVLDIRRTRERTPERKLHHIPNAVDTAAFANPSRERASVRAEFGWDAAAPLLIAVGRLEPEKNYELLVRSMALLAPRHPSARCLLVGDGSRRGELESLVAGLGLGDRVGLAGARNDVPALLGAADLFVISSSKEGLPVSLLEAMAAGLGVVATSVGGVPEAIRDRETGLLVPPMDVEALAAALGELISNESLRKGLGAAARIAARRDYDIGSIVRRTEELYRRLREAKGVAI